MCCSIARTGATWLVAILTASTLSACGMGDTRECDEAANAAPGAEPGADEADTGEPSAQPGRFTIDNAFYYTQITGGGEEIPTLAYVLFEYPERDQVRYQVAYVACTCRGPSVNYYSVAYVELSKRDGSVLYMSYDQDRSGHYSPGSFGDSTETGSGTPVKALFDKFRKDRLVGATPEQIFALEPMHGEVDGYTGATVTPNNAVAMLQGLLEYHEKRHL